MKKGCKITFPKKVYPGQKLDVFFCKEVLSYDQEHTEYFLYYGDLLNDFFEGKYVRKNLYTVILKNNGIPYSFLVKKYVPADTTMREVLYWKIRCEILGSKKDFSREVLIELHPVYEMKNRRISK